MRFGAHVSAAGGLWTAGAHGKDLGCEIIQIFSRPPQGGKPKEITEEDAAKFKAEMKANGIQDVYIHAPYFINFASVKPSTRHGSTAILREELERGTKLGAKAMMFHPGSAKDIEHDDAVQKVIEGLNRIMDGYTGTCQLLIEISAGAGEVMGDTFEEIAAFLNSAERGSEIGVCFDTQHAFASGYDLRTENDVQKTFDLFDEIIGLNKMPVSHCNDSMVMFKGRKDRHEHLGKGHIGMKGFEAIVKHPKLAHLDLILETPFNGNSEGSREEDMQVLKNFRNT